MKKEEETGKKPAESELTPEELGATSGGQRTRQHIDDIYTETQDPRLRRTTDIEFR